MAKEIMTSIEINATPAHVWSVLMDTSAYPSWNPFIHSIKGELKQGNQIDVQVDGMRFRPTVLSLVKHKEFIWEGHFGFRGIFDGTHQFILEDMGDGHTLFIHKENFRGILVPLLWRKLNTETRAGFEAMNQALKKVCEGA